MIPASPPQAVIPPRGNPARRGKDQHHDYPRGPATLTSSRHPAEARYRKACGRHADKPSVIGIPSAV